MGRRICCWELALFLFLAVAGSLLHFVYDWSGNNRIAAVFAAVNESTWEHMKLLFIPLFVFSMVQLWTMGKEYPNFLAARAVSALVGLSVIPMLFYTYTGVFGWEIVWVDLLIFFTAALVTALLDCRLLRRGTFSEPWQQVAGLLILWAVAAAFLYCTFRPPLLPLFRDPVTLEYGLIK